MQYVALGANLEEELFSLISRSEYEDIQDWRSLRPVDEKSLRDRGMNRVTDVAIPEDVFRDVEGQLASLWEDAEVAGDSRFPHEYLYDIILHGDLDFDESSDNSWLVQRRMPIFPFLLQVGRTQLWQTYWPLGYLIGP